MTPITVSVCVPTYNRADFLDYLLTQAALWDFGYSHEIVITDNASTDRTSEIVEKHRAAGLPIRYFRQEFNKGSVANLMTSYHRASGKYVLYLADDDLLIPEELKASLAYLEARPEICALYAPWELYDDINKQTSGAFYTLDRDIVFEKGQEGDMFNFLVTKHIFPEIAIYRADAVRKLMTENQFCFWAFSFLAVMIAHDAVAFTKSPFYRSVTLTPIQPNRAQAGFEQAMTFWDNYRGGLEYLIYSITTRGKVSLSPNKAHAIRGMIDGFVALRMRVALRLWLERGDYVRAYELVCRLRSLNPAEVTGITNWEQFRITTFGQVLARFANSIAELTQLLFVGAGDFAALADLLTAVGLRETITVTNIEPADAATREATLVVLADEGERERFLQLGYPQGLILSEADVLSNIVLAS